MKIEICEQMVQSWLQHCKQCEIVQTNWKVSPLRLRTITDSNISELEKFMKDFQEQLNCDLEDETKAALQEAVDEELRTDEEVDLVKKKKTSKIKKLNIFKKSTAKQFIRQCEIDIVGCKLNEGITESIYLIDTAFHKTGLGYHDPVATVMKKIVRALVVAVIIFGENVPVTVGFVSPKCGDTLKPKIETVVLGLRKILAAHPRYRNIEIELYFNERFTTDIYMPLLAEMDDLNDDNDLFMRAMNLASLAETYRVTSTTSESIPSSATIPTHSTPTRKTPRGENKEIVLDIMNSIVKSGKMTPALLNDLKTCVYTKSNFKLPTFPLLILAADFPSAGYESCRYYPEPIEIFGEEYFVCSQWIPARIAKLKEWYNTL